MYTVNKKTKYDTKITARLLCGYGGVGELKNTETKFIIGFHVAVDVFIKLR